MASSMMTHRERIEATIAGDAVDRPPVALWRHFPIDDQTSSNLAEVTVDFQRAYDFDLVKVSPSSSFCIRDWGAKDEWRGAPEGTRDYTQRVIQQPEDWERLTILDPGKGSLFTQIESLGMIVGELGSDVPVIQTIFNPLAQAKNLVGKENLLIHLRQYPQAVHSGLLTIAKSIQQFIEAARQTGIAGIFYAVQHAQYSLLSEDEYEVFGRTYDMLALEPAQDLGFNMLHLHGKQVMFDRFLDYPMAIINWHDRETPPSLGEAQEKFSGALCGGLRRLETMVLGTPEKVTAEAQDAINATNGRQLILGTGCVMPTIVPRGNILAARQSVEN
ncbi:MAG: uroporphyrinogen decarboxylase family protein [Anaerolineales bacterium]